MQPEIAQVGDENLPRPAAPAGLCDQVADGTGPEDDDIAAFEVSSAGAGVGGDRDGLDAGPLFRREGVGKDDDLVGFRHLEILGHARALKPRTMRFSQTL